MDKQNQFKQNQNPAGGSYGNPRSNPAGGPYGNPRSDPAGAPYNNPYGMPQREKKDGQVYGAASLVLGFLALILFCACINVPLAMLSLFFGMVQIIGYKDKLLAGFGIALSAASIILMIVAILIFTSIHIDLGSLSPNGFGSGTDSYEEYFEQYFNNLEDGSF